MFKNLIKKTSNNSLIQIRHEWLYSNIEKLFEKILLASNISYFVLDDLNRSDHSSLQILLKSNFNASAS